MTDDTEETAPDGWMFVNGKMVKRAWGNVLNGTIPLNMLDDEEVTRMQLRDKNGTFTGGKPALLPRKLAEMQTREILQRNQALLQDAVLKATKVYTDIIDDETASAADKMKAAEYLQNRFLGKTPERVQLTADIKPWEGLVQGILTQVEEDGIVDEGEKADETDVTESEGSDPA